jgi:hypothetical protein
MSSTHSYVAAAALRSTRSPQTRLNSRTRHTAVAREPACRRRQRGTAPAELALLLLLAVLLVVCVFVSRTPRVTPERLSTVSIRSGQTLWDMARSYPVAGLSTAQTAQLIAEINDLEGQSLIAGSTVRVPVTAREAVAAR